MLVRTGFYSVRLSLDGPREINDRQRGKGGFDKALAGIDALHQERQKSGGKGPSLEIIHTVTEENYHSIQQFFLEELPLPAIDKVTIQMQNFITRKMGKAYASLLGSEFGIGSDRYWRGMLRSPTDFEGMYCSEHDRPLHKLPRPLDGSGRDRRRVRCTLPRVL